MSTKHPFPPDTSREELVELHEVLLSQNPKVRVLNRWGDFTEYAVRIKARDAQRLVGFEVDPLMTFRLCIGVSEITKNGERYDSVDVQCNEGAEWATICLDPGGEEFAVDQELLLADARVFIMKKYPIIFDLLMIDRMLLGT